MPLHTQDDLYMQFDAARHIDDYERDGFICPIDVMSEAAAARYRSLLEEVEAAIKDDGDKRRALRRHSGLVLPFVDEITRLPTVLKAVTAILGDDVLVLDTPFFIKEANSTSFVSWHQDLHYWGLDKDDEVTAWVALSPATVASGCMRFVAGSHRRTVAHRDTHDERNLLTRGQEIAVDVDDSDAVDAELRPGQMSLHHGRVFHASNPNATGDRRIGLAIRYVAPGMAQADGSKPMAMLVHGSDDYGNFTLAAPPKHAFDADALAQHKAAADARNAALFKTSTVTSG
ncbi:MAG: phytanoyl-CoA dioxygenase family protein [Hyphomicrobiaceae bacterium]